MLTMTHTQKYGLKFKVVRSKAAIQKSELNTCRTSNVILARRAAAILTIDQLTSLMTHLRKQEQDTWEQSLKRLNTRFNRMAMRKKWCANHRGSALIQDRLTVDTGLKAKI